VIETRAIAASKGDRSVVERDPEGFHLDLKHAGLDSGIVRSELGGFFEVSGLEDRHAAIGQLASQSSGLLHEGTAQNNLSLVVEPADVIDVLREFRLLASRPTSGTEDDDDDRDDEHEGENEALIREVDETTEAPEEFEIEGEVGDPERSTMSNDPSGNHGEGDPEAAARFNKAETRFVGSVRGTEVGCATPA
jgi:hypothetical protein